MVIMQHDYWQIQDPKKPLFPDIEWSKPEQQQQRGRLGIIGGNKLGLRAVAESYEVALTAGAGTVRVLLPDSLKKTVPAVMRDVIYGASNPSGALAKDALTECLALGSWSSALLLIGDAGRNSETAIVYEQLLAKYDGLLVITRDAFDLVRLAGEQLANRPNTHLVLSFAQLQKFFQAVYYPKVLTFSMQLMHLVEALHKFTITYPVSLTVFHQETIIVAFDGRVTTTPWDNPMAIWRGNTPTRAATYLMWTPKRPIEAITASLV